MIYDFPHIERIEDVLPAIKDRPEFIVAERAGHTILNYNVNFEDTFPPIAVAGGSAKMREERSLHNALRRECRGIIFDEKGVIIRRPFHKFFNIGEREETLARNINLSNSHVILDKLDGSMIVPFFVEGRMIWGTKMGDTDVAKPVQSFAMANTNYLTFANSMIFSGWSPIFEWCSRKQKIVIDHPEDQLILTAVRNIRSGHYMPYDTMCNEAAECDIPVVKTFSSQADINSFIEHVRGLENVEGYVIRFPGGMYKMKCDWYVTIHKAKEAILQDRNIVELILENKLDDIISHLDEKEANAIRDFSSEIGVHIAVQSINLFDLADQFVNGLKIDKKTFALEYADSISPLLRPLIFSIWDNVTSQNAYDLIVKTVKNHLTKNVKYDIIRDNWFEGIKYNA